ncbi:MAG: S8 family serine peptidase [Bdellovibrionaceae bacterium]|nr:S8 family serine peptidase [Pseudobdellovibrionaceae bacterium]
MKDRINEFTYKVCFVSLGIIFVLSLGTKAHAQSSVPKKQLPQFEAVPGEYIVKYRSHFQLSQVKSKIQGKASLKNVLSEGSIYHVAMKSENVAALQADADVEYIEPNYYLLKFDEGLVGEPLQKMSAEDVTAQSSTSFTQSLAAVQALQAWNIASINDANNQPIVAPIVAIIDTGLDATHSVFTNSQALWINPGEIPDNGVDDDFNGYIDDVSGWNFISNTKAFDDDEGHGTHVGGIVVGAGLDIFSAQVDQARVQLMPLKFLDSVGAGSTANAVRAIYYAVNNGAKVINCSWGGGSYSQSLHEAMAYAYAHQVLIVAAAGNNASNNDSVAMYPANYDVPGLISVAASNDYDSMASFSNFGANMVHVSAPGVSIFSTYPGNTYASMNGTSMAAPFVAGIAAMALREAGALTGYQIKTLITGSVDLVTKLNGKVQTGGRVNEYKLLQAAKSSAQLSVLATQPGYTPSYKADRSPASESSAKAAGCGLVKGLITSGGSSGGGSGLGFLLVAMIPLLVWLGVRLRTPADGRDKRKFERFNLASEIKIQVGDKELVASMNTISMGGVSFNAESALEKGGLVTMRIASPDGHEQIEVQGKVVWSENNKAYGVQFVQSKTGALAMIQDWTKGLSKAS